MQIACIQRSCSCASSPPTAGRGGGATETGQVLHTFLGLGERLARVGVPLCLVSLSVCLSQMFICHC